MKFYKISKKALKWSEIPQVSYKWNLPILVNSELKVVLGNSLKDSLPDNIFIVMIDNNQREVLFNAFYEIENKIAIENSEKRLHAIHAEFTRFFREVRKKKVESFELFPMKEEGFITEENYILPPPYDFTKHKHNNDLYNEGYVLMEEFIEKTKGKEPEIEVDLEILKELL